jgi:hypothetical protein
LNPAGEPSQDARMEGFTLEHLDADAVKVSHNDASRRTMTPPGCHDPLIPIDPVAEKAAAALQRAAITFFDEDQQEQR